MAQDRSKRDEYHAEWDKNHTTRVNLKLNNNTDADIIAHLKKQPSMQGYIKALIRADIASQKKEKE